MCIEIIKKFKPSQLRLPHGKKKEKVPPETQYQDEFYRSAWDLLSGNCLCPEYGLRAKSGGGSIDFFFSGYKWSIEKLWKEITFNNTPKGSRQELIKSGYR